MNQSQVMHLVTNQYGFKVRKNQEINDDLIDAFRCDFE